MWGNTGVFYGSGNQVIPIKNKQIRLVRENVNIKLTVDENSGQFGVPFIPWANVTAKFYLKNITSKEVLLQMGFPFLDLQGFGDEEYVLSNLNFKVLIDGNEIRTQIKKGVIEKEFDPKGMFKKVFTWSARFKPSENREVIVTYRMLMGIASANSIMRNFDEKGRIFSSIDKLIPAFRYDFGYITKTAYTWTGSIEEALFQIDCSSFYDELKKKSFMTGDGSESQGYTRPIFWEAVNPSAHKKERGIYEWIFKEKVPENGLSIAFTVLFLPCNPAELNGYYTAILSRLESLNPDEFKAILQAYYQIIAFDKKPSISFLTDYFEGLEMLKEPKTFISETDRVGIEEIANDFNRFIR